MYNADHMRPSLPHSTSSSPCPLPVTPKVISRRKRQTGGATNFRIEWLSNSHARLSWRHFADREPPEDSYYTITHVALVVAGGRVLTTYQFFTVSRQSTSFTLWEVSENNFNIFDLSISTPSDLNALIVLRGKYSQTWDGLHEYCTCALIGVSMSKSLRFCLYVSMSVLYIAGAYFVCTHEVS